MNDLQRDLERNGYQVSLRPRLESVVQSCMFGFEGLLYECGLSPRPGQKLNIKLDIDTNPPEGFQSENRLVNTYFPHVVVHHNKASLLAGKLHAIFQCPCTKGRDFFDLWFLSRWHNVVPNVLYLNNALKQTGYRGTAVTHSNWKKQLSAKLSKVEWTQVESDVEPFLLRAEDAKAFWKDLLMELLES